MNYEHLMSCSIHASQCDSVLAFLDWLRVQTLPLHGIVCAAPQVA